MKEIEAQADLRIEHRLTQLFEAVFEDFRTAIDNAARQCRNNDASTALYEVSSAIYAMDVAYTIKEVFAIEYPDEVETHAEHDKK